MFEKAKPPVTPDAMHIPARDLPDADLVEGKLPAEEGMVQATPLRAIEWSELTARLSAAHDLRQLLRADAQAKGTEKLGFADAAAQFFRANEEDERCVNPNALEGRKPSSGMYQHVTDWRNEDPSSADQEYAGQFATPRCEPGDTREER